METRAPNPPRIFRVRALPWIMAFAALAIALLVAYQLKPFLGELAPFIVTFPVIAFSAWRWGLASSFASIAIVLVSTWRWFIEPLPSFRTIDSSHFISFLAFAVVCCLTVAIGEVNRRENLRLVKSQGELEDKVNERTVELDITNGRLSELTARLLQLQDDERRHIARDLHDSVGQTMALLGVNLSNVGADIERVANAMRVLKDSQELVRETTSNVRTISYLLHPPTLDENGLSSALPWFIEGFSQRSGIKVELNLSEDFGRLSRESEVAIFRVVQECLTNIHRHSGSPRAKIEISRTGAQIRVLVQDQGKGIPSDRLRELASGGTPGVGVRGMRERIRQLGGTLEIDSRGEGKGTTVVTCLPYAPSTIPAPASPSSGQFATI